MAKKFEELKGVSRNNHFLIDPAVIEIEDGHNVRKEPAGDLEGLAASIAEVGVKTPLVVRRGPGDRVILVAGERRLRAVRLAQKNGADIKAVPCMLEDRYANEHDHALSMLIENLHRKDLNPIEEAEGFRRLFNWGWDEEKIAKKFGLPETYVKARLQLLAASAKARQAILAGRVSMSAVQELLKKFPEDRAAQDAALEDAVKASGDRPATTKAAKAAATARGAKDGAPRKRTMKWKELDALQRDVAKYLRTNEGSLKVAERTELEGLKRGLRIAMGAEAPPKLEDEEKK